MTRTQFSERSERSRIILENLSIGYKTGGNNKVVMSGIDASVESGRLTCLIGSNGVGKSTLLRTLAAFQPKLGGNILVCGKEITEYTNKELSTLIGVVLTSKPDVTNMTVREIVGLGRTPYTGFWGTLNDADKAIVEQSMEMVGIADLASRMAGTLSDGERQKMMIAKALAQETPDLELVLQTADTLWLMTRDGGVSIGTPRELTESGALSAFIDRRGIVFDKATMSIKVLKE